MRIVDKIALRPPFEHASRVMFGVSKTIKIYRPTVELGKNWSGGGNNVDGHNRLGEVMSSPRIPEFQCF